MSTFAHEVILQTLDIKVFGLFLNIFQYYFHFYGIKLINLCLHFTVFIVICLERHTHPSATLEKKYAKNDYNKYTNNKTFLF